MRWPRSPLGDSDVFQARGKARSPQRKRRTPYRAGTRGRRRLRRRATERTDRRSIERPQACSSMSRQPSRRGAMQTLLSVSLRPDVMARRIPFEEQLNDRSHPGYVIGRLFVPRRPSPRGYHYGPPKSAAAEAVRRYAGSLSPSGGTATSNAFTSRTALCSSAHRWSVRRATSCRACHGGHRRQPVPRDLCA
jgi:hypothetical protein